MQPPRQAVVTRVEERPVEGWDDPVRGRLSWHTLISAGLTPTGGMTAGVATIPAGTGILRCHRHRQPEVYFILEGTGILTIEGRDTVVTAGATVFIPGDAEHGLKNESAADLRLFYVFPTDAFSDVVYRFSD